MKIYTSFYCNKKINNEQYTPIRISLGHPRWKLHYNIQSKIIELMPRRDMFNLPFEKYKEEYYKILYKTGRKKINEIFKKISEQNKNNKNIVILCYENLQEKGAWCHRRIFAEWWRLQTGIDIPEL